MSASRVLVLWFPDWPAAVHRDADPEQTPLAVIESGAVLACTPAARNLGVRRGMRKRDAQANCPELLLRDRDLPLEVALFDEVMLTLNEHAIGVTVLRPGLCALPVPERFHGGETEAVAVLLEAVVNTGVWDVRAGVADGIFVAQQAARLSEIQGTTIVPPGGSAAFLAPLPVEILASEELVTDLRRLGLRRVNQFAALSASDVHARFGSEGLRNHRRVNGIEAPWGAGTPVQSPVARQVLFEPALDNLETVAFGVRRAAGEFVAELQAQGFVCVTLRIELESDEEIGHRIWRHPRWFDTADVVDRVRWQAGVWGASITAVRLLAAEVEGLGERSDGLFGGSDSEQVDRGVARVQGKLGPDAVRSVHVQGGTFPAQRQLETTWGERPSPTRQRTEPWPAAIPAPAPAKVFFEPLPARVLGPEGRTVWVDERGLLVGGTPSRVWITDHWSRVIAWAGPWPVDDQWWDETAARRVARFQVVGSDGSAWLMSVEGQQWWVEAVYD